MKKILTEFNELLKKNDNVAIVNIDDRTEWTISPKKTVEEFITAIETVLNDVTDGSSEIREAKAFDYGYSIEVGLRTRHEDNDGSQTIYLYLASKF